MKRHFAVSLFVLLLVIPALAQNKAAQIADLQNQISNIEQSYPAMEKRFKDLDTQKDNIKFAVDAYTKYNDKYKQDLGNFNQRQNEVNRQQQLLQPSVDNYKQRVAAHNAHQCTEVRGSGTCNWYNNEANQLDANKAQIRQAQAQIDQQQNALEPQRQSLSTTLNQLKQIWDNNQTNIAKWKEDVGQLKSQYEAAAAKEAELKRQLAILQGDNAACLKTIPAACEKPAIGPDGKPILDQNCERMKAACSRMFDGNR